MKPSTYLAAIALLVSGCSASTTTHGAVPHRTPSAPRTTLAGGCAGTPVLRGAPPGWNPRPAGFIKEPDLPYVLGRKGTAMGYIFNAPLVAPPRAGTNKILWYVRQPRNGSPLRITGHPAGADHHPEVTRQFPADSSPGEIYPAAVEVPHPGCWVFTLTWDGHEDDVVLRFSPAARPDAS
jgi:hypothetical protein